MLGSGCVTFVKQTVEGLYFLILIFSVAVGQGDPGIVIAHPGQDVELLCTVTVTDSGSQTAGWLINNMGPYRVNSLRSGLLAGHTAELGSNNLIVENIMMNDDRNSSDYRCVIAPAQGTPSLGNIIEESDPTILYVAVTTEKIPATVIAYPGKDVELFCSITSSNYQIISWKVNNMGPYGLATLREGRLTGYSSNGNNSLIVENITMNDVRNGSNYNCAITSGIAVQRQRDPTILYVAGVSQMVPNVIVNSTFSINRTNITFILSWGEPFNNLDPIMNYTVSCSGDDTCPQNFTTTDNTTRSYTITNLTPATNYTFSVVATNSIGSGEAGVGIIIVPGVPEMVSYVTFDFNVNRNNVTLMLSWGEPFNGFDPIVKYTVSCSGDVTCPSNFTTTDNTTRRYTITNLTPMTNYTFSVVATNSIGSGEAGVVMITTPNDTCQPDTATCATEFYSFGFSEGDSDLDASLDITSPAIVLSEDFMFYNQTIKTVYVNDNGIISLNQSYNAYRPQPLPLSGTRFIAPYWADFDLRGTGKIYYRQTKDPILLARATSEIQVAFRLSYRVAVTNLVIATWDAVGYYNQHTDKINTLQCVLASTTVMDSFVILLYAGGEIQWTTGDDSGGVNGLYGTEALVGINVGDGVNFTTIPGSLTPSIANITQTSNVGIPGTWMFKVHNGLITTPTPSSLNMTTPSSSIVMNAPTSSMSMTTSTLSTTAIVASSMGMTFTTSSMGMTFTTSSMSMTTSTSSTTAILASNMGMTFTTSSMDITTIDSVTASRTAATSSVDMTFPTSSVRAKSGIITTRNTVTPEISPTPTIIPEVVPTIVPDVTVDDSTIIINGSIVTLTLNWGEPFNNREPIVNYTVSCSGDVICPPNFTTTDNTTRRYTITNLTPMTNYTFSVVATNSIGSGKAGIVMITTPSAIDTVSGVTIKCNPLTFIVQCTTEWNPVTLEDITGYHVNYNGTIINVNSSTTTLTFTAPSLPDGVFTDTVFIIVIAVNKFGVGPGSNPATAEIYSSSVSNAMIVLSTPNANNELHSITVTCTIHPDSTADQCVVMAMADDGETITGAAPIVNGMAIVAVNGLDCEVTYTIIAGGTLNGDLVGPRSSHGAITAGPCPVFPQCPIKSSCDDTTLIGAVVGIGCVVIIIMVIINIIIWIYCSRIRHFTVETSSRPHSPPTDDAVTNPTYNTVTITDDHSKQQGKEPIRCYAEVIIPTQLN